MGAFEELNWKNRDVDAIVNGGGIATVKMQDFDDYHEWLLNRGYGVSVIDCCVPFVEVLSSIYILFRWQEQFGYTPERGYVNLNALWDGFDFDIPRGEGHVLELVGIDQLWKSNPQWVVALLEMAHDYSRIQMALGSRFFALLVVEEISDMIGATVTELKIPSPYRRW